VLLQFLEGGEQGRPQGGIEGDIDYVYCLDADEE